MLQRLAAIATRPVHVPGDLEAVTTRGEETGDPAVVEPIWQAVEAVYRTGMHPGIQVCIRHRGEVVLERAMGYARGHRPGIPGIAPGATPMGVDTPVNLFSAAKAVSAMLVHKLDEQGVVALDDPVADHVPGFGKAGKGGITIRHVLRHRSGLPNLPEHAFDLDLLSDPDRIEEVLCEMEPEAAPGGRAAYSAVVGGFVLEAVVRRATGKPMREVMATEIRDPLGLTWFDLGVEPDRVHEVAENVATGVPLLPLLQTVMRRILGTEWSRVIELSNDPRFLAGTIPSANVIVTAHDVAAFYQCLLNGGELDGVRVFEEDTIARATRNPGPSPRIDSRILLPMRYSEGFMLGADTMTLFGWNHPRVFGHLGMSNLWTWADPDRDLVVAILTTGKPVIGSHLVALPQLLTTIHAAFPARD